MGELVKFITALSIVFFALVGFLYHEKEQRIQQIHQEHLTQSRQRLLAAEGSFDKLSQSFYNEQNDYLSRMMYLAQEAHKSDLQGIREELLSRLTPAYYNASLFGLIQFQLHTRSGKSFLRFNHPERYADDLRKLRYSIRTVSQQYLFLKGFEAGRFVDGLRYIYPLFYDGSFVGSYEWVWDHSALVRELRRIYHGEYGIIVLRERLESSLDPGILSSEYRPFLDQEGFLFQKSAYGLYRGDFLRRLQDLSHEHKLQPLLKNEKDFTISTRFDDRELLVTFLLIRDIADKPYGYLISMESENRIAQADSLFRVEVGFLSILFLLIGGILYRNFRERIFTRTLLNSQKDLILLTNGRRLYDANSSFFEFTGTSSIREFIRRFECICNLFIEAEGFLGKEREGLDWLSYLARHPQEEHWVMMYDRRLEEDRIFRVSIDRFNRSELYVVTFRDVTEEEREKRHFKIEALMDHLTGIYNKRAFERYLKDRIRERNFYQHGEIVVVMFDLDYFKEINDRYGHQWGDEILRELTSFVRSRIRRSDFFARWGGDEFMIIMDGIGLDEAADLIERLRHEISEHDFHLEERISCSFGVTELHEEDTAQEVVDRVDRLLYRAKSRGRNRVAVDRKF